MAYRATIMRKPSATKTPRQADWPTLHLGLIHQPKLPEK